VLFRRISSNPPERERGVRADQTVLLQTKASRAAYPEPLPRVCFHDEKRNKRLVFLTNHFGIPASMVADLYRQRWQV
jgi:hypothetical protein